MGSTHMVQIGLSIVHLFEMCNNSNPVLSETDYCQLSGSSVAGMLVGVFPGVFN